MVEISLGERLAFDVGKVRVGVAVSDRYGILASPLVTLDRQPENILKEEIRTLFENHSPVDIVIGLPMNLRNIPTESTEDALVFASLMKSLSNVPIWLVDERLSTVSAHSQLRDSGKTSKNSKGLIDQQSACIILETGLQNLRDGKPIGVELNDYSS